MTISASRRALLAAGAGFAMSLGAASWSAAASPPRREVLAFYYPWYGTPAGQGWRHWYEGERLVSRHTPAQGLYDSGDPRVIGSHMALARAAGLTGLVYSWWGAGSFEDASFAAVLSAAAEHGLRVAPYIEQAKDEGDAAAQLRHLNARYGRSPGRLRVGGRPVVFLYNRAFQAVDGAAWRRAADALGPDAPFLIADVSFRYLDTLAVRAGPLDGVHAYNIALWIKGLDPAGAGAWMRGAIERVRAAAPGKLLCATVIPGYDDSRVPGRTPLIAPREGGRLYQALWRAAIEARPDWVLITSFNEWHEGSEIEPSREYGNSYLRLTARYARLFRQGG